MNLQDIKSLENAVGFLMTRGITDISLTTDKDKTYSVRGSVSVKGGKGEEVIVIIHLDHQERIHASDLFTLKNGKYVVAPTRTLYPSKQRLRVPVSVDSCFRGKPYWKDIKVL